MVKGKKSKGKGKARSSAGGFISDATAVARAVSRLAPYALAAFKAGTLLVNAEVKHADASGSSTVSTTPTLVFLSGIAQGDSNITRDGNSVKCEGLWGDITYIMSASATVTRIRTLIFADTRNAGAAPTAADVFDTGDISGLPNVDSEPNRFAILLDRVECMTLASESRCRHFRFNLGEVAKSHLVFSGTTNGIASAKGLVYYLLMMSSEATNTPTYSVNSRLMFIDN